MSETIVGQDQQPADKAWRLALLVLGIVVGQCLLYGPSLIGNKVLLPLDVLAMPGCYVPDTPQTPNTEPFDIALQDLVLQFEPDRLFAAKELKAGRFPQWIPYEYGGVPFSWPKYSPFLLFTCLTVSPIMVAWGQLLEALVAGIGAYFFFRRSLRISFWPGAVAAWCYPMTGFFIFWQGFPTCASVYWLPWLLLAVDGTIRGNRAAPLGMAVVTGLALVSGHIDVAGQMLLVSGLFAIWCLWDVHRLHLLSWGGARSVLPLVLGWGLGFFLAAPHIVPLLEHAKTGARMEQRAAGFEVRPPVGLTLLPQVVLPDMYGSTARGSPPPALFGAPANLQESGAAAYTGLLAAALVAPWAWYSRRHRSVNWFWTLLAIFGLSWCLNIRGLVDVLRLPGLNMMSHNRLVFATSFALLAMAATGLEAARQGLIRGRWPFWLQLMLLSVLLGWCVYGAQVLPDRLGKHLEEAVRAGNEVVWIKTNADVRQAQTWFSEHYKKAAAWCAAAVILGLVLRFRLLPHKFVAFAIGVLLLLDLFSFSQGRNPQCDPALHYPEIPALGQVAKAASGRIIGAGVFPANLSLAVGLKDVCGYDSVDPARWVNLLTSVADEHSPKREYALTQWMSPLFNLAPPSTLRFPPILDMLGVQYLILRGTPPEGIKPAFQSPDYWVLENRSALPRVFVPRRVETVPDKEEMFHRLGQMAFDPREVAYVETALDLRDECRGMARIVVEIPTRIEVMARMETPGLLVLADSWDRGWRAYVNGRSVPILRTNYALRGVILPRGSARIEFHYEPASLKWGIALAGAAVLILLGWLGKELRVWEFRS